MLGRELEKLRQAMRTGTVATRAKVPRVVDGEMRYEDVTIYPLESNGVEGAVVRVDDVTERVRIEEMMVQSEKMLSVGGLAAGMAHEINNPLGVILQASQNVLRRVSPEFRPTPGWRKSAVPPWSGVRQYLETARDPDVSRGHPAERAAGGGDRGEHVELQPEGGGRGELHRPGGAVGSDALAGGERL